MRHDLQTTSNLAQRFQAPGGSSPGCAVTILLLIAFYSCFAVSASLWWLLLAVPAVPFALLGSWSIIKAYPAERQQMAIGHTALQNGYFCHRDGIAYHPANGIPFTPESYVKWCFQTDS